LYVGAAARRRQNRAVKSSRVVAFALLVMANLLWSGNWVIGRAVRESLDPVVLNFWRWAVAALVMAPLGLPEALAHRALIRRHAGLFALMALTGVALFQTLVYLGLRTTTAINAVLINAAGPLFMVLCSWLLDGVKPSLRQIAGMLISFLGVVIIVSHGEVAALRHLEFHAGDVWILLAMPMWGIYSVLLKRTPHEVRGMGLAFTVAAIGMAMMLPLYLIDLAGEPLRAPSVAEVGAILYIAVVASVVAFLAWNRGVALAGANAAGFTMPLLPAFGTLLAIIFLGEAFRAYHAVAFIVIFGGVVLATHKRGG
jgi:drug/metabolite transporter (DMT)-like permease